MSESINKQCKLTNVLMKLIKLVLMRWSWNVIIMKAVVYWSPLICINKQCKLTNILIKLIKLVLMRWSWNVIILKAVVYWSLLICKSLIILGREKLMLISWENFPWLYKLSRSSLAGSAVAVDCTAFCCLASCAVYCVLRLARCNLKCLKVLINNASWRMFWWN